MTGWIALILTTIGVFLTARKNIWCWPFLILANILWTVDLWNSTSAVVMQGILFVFNIYGVYKWKTDTSR